MFVCFLLLTSPLLRGMSVNQKLQLRVIPCYSFCDVGTFLLPFEYSHLIRLIPQPNRLSPSSYFCHTSNQFPSWSWFWSWILFVMWINQTIFGLLSSSPLFMCLCLSSQSFYVVSSPHFCFSVTSVISFRLHLGLPLPCFPYGQLLESFLASLKCVM